MDLDIEMGDGPDASHEERFVEQPQEDILGTGEADEPGEIAEEDQPAAAESTKVVPTKLHIRGVDTLHTDDIKAYVKSHFGPVDRVEWIDDTSANLVFSSEPTAEEALVAISAVEIADVTALSPSDTLPAKPVADKPEVSLQLRVATESDKKQAGAATRSRYYLLHPEHDPEERRRRHQGNRSRYRERDGDHRRDGGRRRRRDSEERSAPFDASMYDDAPPAERRRSDDGDRPVSRARENRGKELFAGRRESGRSRSASPTRARNGVDLFDERAKSTRNRNSARDIKKHISAKNDSKELFATKMSSGRGRLDDLEDAIGSAHLRDEDRPRMAAAPDLISGHGSHFNIRGTATQSAASDRGYSIKGTANAQELFPTKLGGSNAGKELLGGSRRARRKAEDLFG